MANKTFTVECTMEERWIPEFYMFLAKMQTNGEMGHSELLGFYSDGDGDFRPKFEFDKEYKPQHGYWERELKKENPERHLPKLEVMFDAG